MIVREMPNGQLLCLNQTTHAHMAAQFVQHWGNADFAPPTPYDEMMLAVSQHDNGWYEWELTPRLCADGYPMDFLKDDAPLAKLDLWRLSVNRVYAQHPYAALPVHRHAAWLYQGALHLISDEQIRAATVAFIEEGEPLLAQVRNLFAENSTYAPLLSDAALDANTRLLQFGDFAVLQIAIPWANERTMPKCPLNHREQVDIQMRYDEATITFDPWPFGVDTFTVSIHGRLLRQRHFASEAEYHAALVAAPLRQLQWVVARG
ncbi:MAG: DUF3891 family protein [Caldilineaceae bacterium]|nr:DUF3891 family protein [Caldilineaceae bacterium]